MYIYCYNIYIRSKTKGKGENTMNNEEIKEFKNNLAQFCGSEDFFSTQFIRGFVYTEGVRYFAEKAGAYWLVDDVALFFKNKVKMTGFATVKAISKNNKVRLVLEDEGVKYGEKRYSFSDLPEGEWLFYLQYDGQRVFMMLPSEY